MAGESRVRPSPLAPKSFTFTSVDAACRDIVARKAKKSTIVFFILIGGSDRLLRFFRLSTAKIMHSLAYIFMKIVRKSGDFVQNHLKLR